MKNWSILSIHPIPVTIRDTAVAFFSRPARRELLRILDLPDEERVREIGRLHREGTSPGVAELLMDLETEPSIRRLVAAELRAVTMGK